MKVLLTPAEILKGTFSELKENLVASDPASTKQKNEKEKPQPEKLGIWGSIWRGLKKIWKVVVGVVVFLSALFACIHYWPEIQQKLQPLFSH